MKKTKKLTAAIIASAVALSMLSIPAYAMDDSTPPLTETAAASSDDMKAPLADLVIEYVWRDYYEKTGNMAVECEMLENDEGTEATVTLKDETGAVLDVYTVDLLTGIGINQNGEESDLTQYVSPFSDDECFVPFDAIDSIARKHYHLQTGVWPDSSYSCTNEDKDGLFIVLSDAEGNPLAVYTIDVKTGIGTDAEGNDVDLSVYADYELLTEEDYFISSELFDDAGQGYFTEQTGIQPYMTYYYVDDIIPVAEITFFDEDDNLLERYMIDPATGIGTDNSGNLVDLAEYADTHEISDEYPRSEIDETGFFAPVDVILEYAKKEYIEKTGIVPNGFSFMITPNSDNAEIEVLGNDGILDVYSIDVRTGIGTNQDGDMIDLTAYAEKMNDPEEPVNLDESDYFAPSDDFSVFARADYIKKNQTMPELALTMIALDTLKSEIQIYNAEFDIVDRYMIDVKTGSGKNSEETPVDLSVYARETDESGFFASMDEMCQMAKTDFTLKTGAECETAEAVWDSTDNTVVIMLTDAEGAPLDYCIIDPLTGVGSSAYGHEVNLPQTGNNAAGSLMAAVGALLMIGAGTVAIKSSGVVRRKED